MSKELLKNTDKEFIINNFDSVCLLKEKHLGLFLETWIKKIPTLLDLECVQKYYLKYPDILDELLESDIRQDIISRDLVEYCTDDEIIDSDEELEDLPQVIDMNAKQLRNFYRNKKVNVSTESSCSGSSFGCETSGSECSLCSLE